MLSDIIEVNDDKCVGCSQCISVCPQSETNIAVFDGKTTKVKLDQTKCIHCGACLEVCSHGARKYVDDSEEILKFINSGKKYIVAVAPSVRVNFNSRWENILSTFREAGAQGVYDVSVGADICTWAHVKYFEKYGSKSIITQPCPVIVNYISKYRHDLIDLLSPIHSPMLCLAIFLQRYLNIKDKIIFLSPCISKRDEFKQTSLDAFNLTFENLQKFFDSGNLKMSPKRGSFDLFKSGLGRIFSKPGGLKENIEFYMGSRLSVSKIEGRQKIYPYFSEINSNTRSFLPDIIDALNCENGCNFGTGCQNRNCKIEVEQLMEKQKRQSAEFYPKTSEHSNELFDWFDQNLKLDDFIRHYEKEECGQVYKANMTIDEAFNLLGKHTFEERNFNCGACGAHSCSEMAEKISKGLNVPNNCVWKVKQELAQEGKKIGEFSQSLTRNVYQMTDELKQAVSELSSRNTDLVSALKAIGKIASTTQLLSINTSIEAKRAGTAGTTFSVIAGEIKRLSDDSSKTEKKMEQMVRDNSVTTNHAVDELDKIMEMLQKISEVVNQLAE